MDYAFARSRDAAALWKLGASGANMIRRPSICQTSLTEMAAKEEKVKTEKRKKKLTMTLEGRTFTLSVKKYVTKNTSGAMSSIVRSHVIKATEACGDFALSIVA
eukprot:COSAG06_NODE_42394_length_382_cov_0.720848_1_plen_103_part_10